MIELVTSAVFLLERFELQLNAERLRELTPQHRVERFMRLALCTPVLELCRLFCLLGSMPVVLAGPSEWRRQPHLPRGAVLVQDPDARIVVDGLCDFEHAVTVVDLELQCVE